VAEKPQSAPVKGLPTEAEVARHLDRWLFRYGIKQGYARWMDAEGTKNAHFIAFSTIASDAGILGRLSRKHSIAMAKHAEQVVAEVGLGKNASPATATTAMVVGARIVAWRELDMKRQLDRDWAAVDKDDQEPSIPDGTEAEPISERTMASNLVKDYPQIRPSSARFAFATTRQLGVAGLIGLGDPMASIFVQGAARVAAWNVLGKLPGEALPDEECLEVVRIAQDWGVKMGTNPFAANDYGGKQGTLVSRIAARALESNACMEMSAQLPGGVTSPGFAQWEDAVEIHSYALMAVASEVLDGWTFDDARLIGSAAARLAAHAIAHPECALPELPDVPVSSPTKILGTMTSRLGGNFVSRQSPDTPFRLRLAPPKSAPVEPVTTSPVKRPRLSGPPVWSGVGSRR
jgi:hypothetical protein